MRQGLILIASLVQRSELSFEAGAMDHVQSRATNASPQSMFHQEFKIKNNSQSQEKQETQGKKGAHTTKQYKKPKEAKGKKKATESKWQCHRGSYHTNIQESSQVCSSTKTQSSPSKELLNTRKSCQAKILHEISTCILCRCAKPSHCHILRRGDRVSMYKRQEKINLDIVLHILAYLGNPTPQQRKKGAPAPCGVSFSKRFSREPLAAKG